MYQDNSYITVVAGEALEDNRLVKLSAARTVVYADATDTPIGVTTRKVANGEPVAIKLLNGQGTIQCTAKAAITVNAELYGDADGKVNDADPGSGVKVGIALEEATAENDIIEVYPVQTPL
jgi:hypothetical protein